MAVQRYLSIFLEDSLIVCAVLDILNFVKEMSAEIVLLAAIVDVSLYTQKGGFFEDWRFVREVLSWLLMKLIFL